jgi:hypothetical protein
MALTGISNFASHTLKAATDANPVPASISPSTYRPSCSPQPSDCISGPAIMQLESADGVLDGSSQ